MTVGQLIGSLVIALVAHGALALLPIVPPLSPIDRKARPVDRTSVRIARPVGAPLPSDRTEARDDSPPLRAVIARGALPASEPVAPSRSPEAATPVVEPRPAIETRPEPAVRSTRRATTATTAARQPAGPPPDRTSGQPPDSASELAVDTTPDPAVDTTPDPAVDTTPDPAVDTTPDPAVDTAILSPVDAAPDSTLGALRSTVPEVPAPGPTATPSTLPGPAFDRGSYSREVRQHVESHKQYPGRARRRGIRGVVTVRVVVQPDGHLAGPPRLVRSSGAAVLDREALRMTRVAEPFDAHPGPAAITIDIPVRFVPGRR